jgi:glutamyl-tRNA synthetase
LCSFIEQDVDAQFASHFPNWSRPVLLAMIDLYKERVRTLKELIDNLRTVHERPHSFTTDPAEDTEKVITYLAAFNDALMKQEECSREAVDQLIKVLCTTFSVPMPQIAQPLRRALTGATSSPGVASLIALMGCDEVVHRISFYGEYLKKGMKR